MKNTRVYLCLLVLGGIGISSVYVFSTKDRNQPELDNISADSTENKGDVNRSAVAHKPVLAAQNDYQGLLISFIAGSESQKRAVIMYGDGTTHTITVGDRIANSNLELLQVTRHKLVLKDKYNQALYLIKKSENSQSSPIIKLTSELTLHNQAVVNKAIPQAHSTNSSK